MKCTKLLHGGSSCGKETGMDCPDIWRKHSTFDPRALKAFFLGTEYDQQLDLLEAFLCPEHREEFKEDLAHSRKLSKASQESSRKSQEAEEERVWHVWLMEQKDKTAIGKDIKKIFLAGYRLGKGS